VSEPATQHQGAGRGGKWMILIIAVLAILAALGWAQVRIDTSLEPMLPQSSEARNTLRFLRDSSFASKAVLWFRLTGQDKTPSDLFAAADATEKKLDPKLITRVIRPPRGADALQEVLGLLDHAGELLTAQDLAELDTLSAPDALGKRLRECYLELLKPQGSLMQPVIRRDPLGINTRILARFYELSQGMGYNVQIQDGRLVHPDGRQLLLIVEAASSATNLAGSEALAAHLQSLCAAAPPGVQIVPICAQIHTAQNQQLMQHDIKWASVIDSVAFFLLFLAVRRDWRVAAVFLLPLVTILITIGLCALVFPNLSVIVIGMSITMAGSTMDYGIFVFTGLWLGADPKTDLQRMRKPLILCLLTTLGVFVAFLLSDIPAYRQLGVMTSISLILALLGAMFVLPVLPRPNRQSLPPRLGLPVRRWGAKMIPAVVAGGLLLTAAVILATRVRFDSDITKLDGITPAQRSAEAAFQSTWGRSDTEKALLVVTAKTRAQAEELSDQVNALMAGKIPQGRYVSLSSFWPSAATRHANQTRWRSYWTDQRLADLRRNLTAAGAPYDFSARAFEPFFQSLADPPQEQTASQILSTVEEQFVARSGPDWQILNYFEDTPENLAAAAAATHDLPAVQIVSRGAVGAAFARSAVSESYLLVPIALALIIGSLIVMTRSAVQSALMLLPVIAGIVTMLAIMVALAIPISVITVVVGIFVLALTTDYGIFAVVGWNRDEGLLGQGMISMHLSAITTVIGSAALLLGIHPATFQVGVSLTAGLLIGYLTAFLMVPGLCYLRHRRKKEPAP
jgi:uncharacterized protein